ncbi:hypothetical protein AHAS_Ahas07G0149600 [Arachis hypogaea]
MDKDCRMKISHRVNFSKAKKGEECLFYASSQKEYKKKNNIWYFDNGCNNYMARDQSLFN